MNKFKQLFRIVLILFITIFSLCFTYGCKSKKNYVTVSFETNGGTPVTSMKVKKGNAIGELPSTSKENYEFVGWFTSNEGSTQVTSEYIVKKDIKLYAHFNESTPYVTITYNTDGGTEVKSSVIKKGGILGSLPFTDKIGYTFLGWFTTSDGTVQVYEDDIVYKDTTLYAQFEKQDIDTVLPEFTEVSIDSDDNYYEIMVTSEIEIDERSLIDYISVSALYGELPKIRISKSNDYYVLSPVGGFKTGGVYVFTLLSDEIHFTNLNIKYESESLNDSQIKTVNLSITGNKVSKVEYKNGIIEIPFESIEFDDEKLIIDEELFKQVPLDIDAIIHITSDIAENDYYVKVLDIEKIANKYSIQCDDCDVDEIYEDFDFNEDDVTAVNERTLDENKAETDLMLQELVASLYDSEGTANLTAMLANALNASPTVKSYTSKKAKESNSYMDRVTDKTGISITVEGLLEDLKITATLGSAKNPNFNGISIPAYNEDRWTMLQLSFEYEGTLKNKVKLEATITITQYIYVWFSFNANSKTGNFKVEATPFSQTDIEFKVLICSTSGEEDDDKDGKKEEKKDISVEISKLVDGEGDSSNIIQDVQEMLENKGDAIELCKAPLFQASYVFGGVISLNFDLNFVIKVSFAAGVKIEATILEATTIGITGNYKTRQIESYRRATKGSDRYIFDFYAYGYLGIKAGIEGEITVSFTGLKKALRAGVGLEVGAYADLYGYLHYHAEERRVYKDIDTNGRHFQTLEGGIYFEMGIYVELSAFIGVGKKEFSVSKEFKFKLLEAGDKYLYVEPLSNENLKLIFNENEEGTLDLEGIIPAEGKFLNIVTGEIETRTIPAKNIRIVSLSNIYKSDNQNHQLLINEEKMDKRTENIPSGRIALYYKGPNILFSSKSLGENIEELKGFKQLTEITVYYIRDGIEIEEEQLGKEVTVTYQVATENKVDTVKTIKLIAGQNIDGYIPEEIIYYCKANKLLWDLSTTNAGCSYDGPVSGKEMVTEDKTYTFTTTKAIRFIAVEYMSNYSSGIWTVEIYAMSFEDLPSLSEKHLAAPTNIYVSYNVIEPDGKTHPMGTKELLDKYDPYMRGTYGYETGVVLASYTGTKDQVTEEFAKMKNNEGTFGKYNDYFTYTLSGEYAKSVVTVVFYDNFGNFSNENVTFGDKYLVPNYWINNMNNTAGLRFVGWDTNNDGKVDILPGEEFVVESNMILKPVMSGEAYTITITDESGNTDVYNFNYGDTIPQTVLDIINNSPCIQDAPNADSFYEESYWRICTSDFVTGDNNTAYFKNITLVYQGDISTMPACDMTFQAVKGKLYHYITFTDNTGGYYQVTNEDGTSSNLATVKLAVEDGSYVGYSKDYDKIKYVKPEDTETLKYIYSALQDENGELLDIYAMGVTGPKTYYVQWWKVVSNRYAIEFEVVIYDEYGNIIEKNITHNHANLTKEKYDELIVKYEEEYSNLTSSSYYEELSENSDYIYSSYSSGELNLNTEITHGFYENVNRYYRVCIRKVIKTYKVTINWNSDPSSYEQITERICDMKSLFECESSGYYYFETDPVTGGAIIHYFMDYDVDGDGTVDYKPGEFIIITEDMTLVALWS